MICACEIKEKKAMTEGVETPRLNPDQWVQDHGDILFRYALARVRDAALAEDMVQETFLAAIKSHDKFSGRSAERTWLVGILKHKIIDYIRKASRQTSYEDMDIPAQAADLSGDFYFDRKGHWKIKPPDWQTNPRQQFEQEEFHDVLQNCLTKLPDRLRQVFILRELEDMDADEICQTLDITPSNLWVMLHRARNGLKGCLEKNWLNPVSGEAS
jgi:RNA polymerase sigma-70 factor (ECF subfamily)